MIFVVSPPHVVESTVSWLALASLVARRHRAQAAAADVVVGNIPLPRGVDDQPAVVAADALACEKANADELM